MSVSLAINACCTLLESAPRRKVKLIQGMTMTSFA
jgi:hypothetical protein